MTLAPPHPFDRDTALEPRGDGRWTAWAPEHWFVGRGPNGGFLAALAARASETAAARPLRSLALHYLVPPASGQLEVAATVERAGRSFSGVSVRIAQEGEPVTLALATLGELPDDGPAWSVATLPQAPPPESVDPVDPGTTGVPAFFRNYELRPALGAEAQTGGWLRTTAPRTLDAPLVAALTDAWAPAAFAALGRIVAAPTLDLTIYVRRPLPPPGMGPGDFVLARFTSRLSVGGVWEEDGELWTPGGDLIAQSRQLALARELPA